MDLVVRLPNFWIHKPASEVERLAIALETDANQGSRHLAIIYVDDDHRAERTRWLHLAWHHRVSDRACRDYAWAEPAIEPEVGDILGRLCRRITKRYGGRRSSIGYALRYAGERFDEMTGEFICEDGLGLTCATFVMAVFATRGVDLLRREEWQPRAEDRRWQQDVVNTLRAQKIEPHAAYVEKDIGCARYRPEEVAAAGVAAALPLGFNEAESRGQEILAWLAQQVARAAASGAP